MTGKMWVCKACEEHCTTTTNAGDEPTECQEDPSMDPKWEPVDPIDYL